MHEFCFFNEDHINPDDEYNDRSGDYGDSDSDFEEDNSEVIVGDEPTVPKMTQEEYRAKCDALIRQILFFLAVKKDTKRVWDIHDLCWDVLRPEASYNFDSAISIFREGEETDDENEEPETSELPDEYGDWFDQLFPFGWGW